MKKERSATILLSWRERDLISKHGYPFEGIEKQITDAGDTDVSPVTETPFWWERIIGNLYISETDPERGDAATELRQLIDRIAKELELENLSRGRFGELY